MPRRGIRGPARGAAAGGPGSLAGAEYGYDAELCSYARTHLGCSVLTLQEEGERSGVLGMNDSRELAARLPSPDFFVNNYAGCSTGQQWDGISYRVFGKQLPIFGISHPFLWGNKPDAGYLRGEEWESASRYMAGQLRELISFLEAQTGRPFDYDALSEAMTYIKRAAELRREGLDLCKAKPAQATFWDWIACVAPINFLPGDQALVDYFAGVRDEIAKRLRPASRASGQEVRAVLRRHHELEQARVPVPEIRRIRRRRAVRPVHPQCLLAGAAAHRHRRSDARDGPALPALPDQPRHQDPGLPHAAGLPGLRRRRHRLPLHPDVPRVHRTAAAAGEVGQGQARHTVDLLRGRRRRRLLYKEEILESRLVAMLEAVDVRRARGGQLAGAGASLS